MTKFRLGPTASCIVGLYALLAMWGWFFLGIVFSAAVDGTIQTLLSILQASGIVATMVFLFSFAFAADGELDERELSERNRAFVIAWMCLFATPVLGIALPDLIASAWKVELTVAAMKGFVLAMASTIFVLPGFLLAWRTRQG